MTLSSASPAQLRVQAYNAISGFFKSHQDEVVEIEMLPPEFQPANDIVLQDGINLGVSKKVLALAFVEARERFFKSREEASSSSIALESTCIILLFDPEHITAANFRKHHLLHLKSHSVDSPNFKAALTREFTFLTSILTSPLHRQSKSPTLWHHRAFLCSLLSLSSFSTAQLQILRHAELDAVCKSGERHPKNYYAWQYARRLVTILSSLSLSTHALRAETFQSMLVPCTSQIKYWCEAHPSDISGWTFLAWLLGKLDDIGQRRILVEEIVDYAVKLQLKNASVWVFVRTVLTDGTLREHECRHAVVKKLRELITDSLKVSPCKQVVEETLEWIQIHGS